MQAKWRTYEFPLRVFLLGEPHETDFRKDSKGGMVGSKQYFDIGELAPEDSRDLAEKLKGRSWSDLM